MFLNGRSLRIATLASLLVAVALSARAQDVASTLDQIIHHVDTLQRVPSLTLSGTIEVHRPTGEFVQGCTFESTFSPATPDLVYTKFLSRHSGPNDANTLFDSQETCFFNGRYGLSCRQRLSPGVDQPARAIFTDGMPLPIHEKPWLTGVAFFLPGIKMPLANDRPAPAFLTSLRPAKPAPQLNFREDASEFSILLGAPGGGTWERLIFDKTRGLALKAHLIQLSDEKGIVLAEDFRVTDYLDIPGLGSLPRQVNWTVLTGGDGYRYSMSLTGIKVETRTVPQVCETFALPPGTPVTDERKKPIAVSVRDKPGGLQISQP